MPSVLLLDDDPDLLDLLAQVLAELCGCEVVLARSVGDLAGKRDAVLACDLAVLDINLGPDQPSGVDALRWLEDHGFGGRVVFLTGHARSHPLVAGAIRAGEAEVLTKPIAIEDLVDLVEEARRSCEARRR